MINNSILNRCLIKEISLFWPYINENTLRGKKWIHRKSSSLSSPSNGMKVRAREKDANRNNAESICLQYLYIACIIIVIIIAHNITHIAALNLINMKFNQWKSKLLSLILCSFINMYSTDNRDRVGPVSAGNPTAADRLYPHNKQQPSMAGEAAQRCAMWNYAFPIRDCHIVSILIPLHTHLHFWYLNFVRFILSSKVVPGSGPGRLMAERRRRTVHHRPLYIGHGHGNGGSARVQHPCRLAQLRVVEGLQRFARLLEIAQQQ